MDNKQEGKLGAIKSFLLLPYDLLRVFVLIIVHYLFNYGDSSAYMRPADRNWYQITVSLIMWALLVFFTGRTILYEKWDVVMACPQYTNSGACYEEEAYYEGGDETANAYVMLTFQKEIIRDIDYCDGNLCYLDNESHQAYTLKKIGTKYYWRFHK